MVKPDGVQRGLVGAIIQRLERRGYHLAGIKMLQFDRALAEKHYAEHIGKPFFEGLVQYICSGPVVAMVWEGKGVIAGARQLMGATDPAKATPGTIRADFAIEMGRNVIHGSDAPESAAREIDLYFKPSDLLSYSRIDEGWLYE